VLGICVAAPVALADLLVVLNKDEHTAALVDPGTYKVVTKLPTGDFPHEVAVTPDGRWAFVANYGSPEEPGHTLTMLDLRKHEVLRTIELGTFTRPHGIHVSRDGQRVWVTSEGARSVLEIAAATGLIVQEWRTNQETSHMLVPTRDESKLYVTNIGSGSVSVINRETNKVRSFATGAGAEGIDCSPLDGTIWVADREVDTLSVIDPAADTLIASFKTAGRMPIRVQFTPDGREVWVSNAQAKTVSVYDSRTRGLIATIEDGEVPVGIQMSPNGRRAFVANTGANRISVIDVKTRKVIRAFTTGKTPDGMAWANAR
jgi:YVTN family beta-propeller protein